MGAKYFQKDIFLYMLILISNLFLTNCVSSEQHIRNGIDQARSNINDKDYKAASQQLRALLYLANRNGNEADKEEIYYLTGICYIPNGIENMNDTQITLMKENFEKSLLVTSKYKAEIDSCVEKAFYGTYLSGSKLHANGQADLENGDKDKARANFEKAKIKLELAYKLKPSDENTIKRLNEINKLLNK